MKKYQVFSIFFLTNIFFIFALPLLADSLSLTADKLHLIARQVYFNECAGLAENIVYWNEGENFLSAGIGHFIWYPKGRAKKFDESFPAMVNFLKKNRVKVPDWLDNNYCPWATRQDFLNDFSGQRVEQLRQFLLDTRDLQALYLLEKLNRAFPRIMRAAPKNARSNIRQQFLRLKESPGGDYVLVDYVNFKGEGILPTERVNGQGWGLLQVLGEMKGLVSGVEAVEEFVAIADRLLTQRMTYGVATKDQAHWLDVWRRRLNTYITTAQEEK